MELRVIRETQQVGMFANLWRWFRGDVTTDPDGARKKGVGGSFVADESDSSWLVYQDFMAQEQNRIALYTTYDQMDYTDIAAGILDMYSEDATPMNRDKERTIWVESSNTRLAKECNELLSRIDIESEITAMAREIAKYGDAFERTVYKKGFGVIATHSVHPKYVHRKEDKSHKLMGFMQDGKKFRNKSNKLSYMWDYIHFRLRGRRREGVYGWSILYNMIRPWRQLIIAEDHSLMYQISRHPDRNLYMLDLGTMDEVDARRTIQRFKQALRVHPYTDPASSKFDHRFNPITPMEDMVVGLRQNSNTRVEKLSGSTNANEVNNLTYYINKMFSAARMPKKAFGFESSESEPYNSKASVANQDIKYARNVARLQRALKTGIRTLCCIHLLLKMSDPEKDSWMDFRVKGNDFQVKMEPVSWLAELEKMEFEQLRTQVTDQLVQMGRDHPAFNSHSWVAFLLRDYLGLTNAQIKRVLTPPKKADKREDQAFAAGMPMDQQGGIQQTSGTESVYVNMKPQDRKVLDEMIRKYPNLDNVIELGRALWAEIDGETETTPEIKLPDDKMFEEDDFEDSDIVTEYVREDAGYINKKDKDKDDGDRTS